MKKPITPALNTPNNTAEEKPDRSKQRKRTLRGSAGRQRASTDEGQRGERENRIAPQPRASNRAASRIRACLLRLRASLSHSLLPCVRLLRTSPRLRHPPRRPCRICRQQRLVLRRIPSAVSVCACREVDRMLLVCSGSSSGCERDGLLLLRVQTTVRREAVRLRSVARHRNDAGRRVVQVSSCDRRAQSTAAMDSANRSRQRDERSRGAQQRRVRERTEEERWSDDSGAGEGSRAQCRQADTTAHNGDCTRRRGNDPAASVRCSIATRQARSLIQTQPSSIPTNTTDHSKCALSGAAACMQKSGQDRTIRRRVQRGAWRASVRSGVRPKYTRVRVWIAFRNRAP